MRQSGAGFGLFEVLVSLAIFGFAALALARGFALHLSFNALNDERSGAMQAVAQVIDDLRSLDPRTLPASGTDPLRRIRVGARTYDVAVSYCSRAAYCTSNNIRTIRCEAKIDNETRYAVETVFAQLK